MCSGDLPISENDACTAPSQPCWMTLTSWVKDHLLPRIENLRGKKTK